MIASATDCCHAGVAKLVDARDLKSLGLGCAGSIPAARTSLPQFLKIVT
jgi:hypothetical protein